MSFFEEVGHSDVADTVIFETETSLKLRDWDFIKNSLNGNLRNTSYMKKISNYELSNISLVQNKILCILVFCNSAYFL